jgi:hypothetical protein
MSGETAVFSSFSRCRKGEKNGEKRDLSTIKTSSSASKNHSQTCLGMR